MILTMLTWIKNYSSTLFSNVKIIMFFQKGLSPRYKKKVQVNACALAVSVTNWTLKMASKQIIDSELEMFSCTLNPWTMSKKIENRPKQKKKRQRYLSHRKIPVLACRHNNKRCNAGNLGNLHIVD